MPAGRSLSPRDRRSAASPAATQWTKVPLGASGSSTTIATWFVPAGGAVQASGGDTLAPLQVKRTGTVAPSAKAGLDTCIRLTRWPPDAPPAVVTDGGALLPRLQP